MKPNASYSALGRIRRLFIFDTTEYVISETSTSPFEDIGKCYTNLSASLNKFNEDEKTELFIFFTINPYGRRVMPMYDSNLGMHFIPVNMIDAEASIPTSWIQDIMFVSNDGNLLLSKFYFSDALKKIICLYAETNNVEMIERECPGGNIMRGRLNGEDYLLHGYAPFAQCNQYYLSKTFKIKINQITKVFDNDMNNYEQLFFHVDLYSTIVGPVGENGDELILLAKCDALKYPQVRKGLDGLEEKMKRMRSAQPNKKKRFVFENIPFIVLQGVDGKIVHALSYNNCLVENFTDRLGNKRIRIYFPDYHDELKSFAQENAENELVMLNMVADLYGAAVTNNINPDFNPAQQFIDPVLTTVFLDTVHNLIRKILSKYDITEIEFVKHDFRNNANRLGSLRCMTKVVMRDCLN